MTSRIPITIVNGFLGAGKTTIILNLLKQLDVEDPTQSPPPTDLPLNSSELSLKAKYSVVWIKNEFGVNEVDSVLAQQSSITSIKEITNGCLCCTLVGRLSDSLYELLDENNIKCDRIIIETSGSAYPATLVQEINRIAYPNASISPLVTTNHQDTKETRSLLPIRIDGVICVVDGLNFNEYSDTSYTAKIQAQYTDLIILNKWELMTGEESIEELKDMLYELHPDVQIVKTNRGWIHYDVVFGLESTLWDVSSTQQNDTSNEYVGNQHVQSNHQNSPVQPQGIGNDVDVVHLEWITPIQCTPTSSTLISLLSSNSSPTLLDSTASPESSLPRPPPTDCVTSPRVPTNYSSFTAQNPITLHAFEEWLTQVSTLYHCLRIKGVILLQLSSDHYKTLILASQNGDTFSPTHLLSSTPIPLSATTTSPLPQMQLFLPVIVNWAFNRWSFYPLPQYFPNISSISNTSDDIFTHCFNYQLPPAIFIPSSLYQPSTLDSQHTFHTTTSPSPLHIQTFYTHSRLTLFGGHRTISTFSFQKLIKKHFPVNIRKDCCATHELSHELCNHDQFYGGFVTVLSNDHTHNH